MVEQSQTSFEDKRLRTGVYAKIANLIKEFLQIHIGERFDLNSMCKELEILERDNRQIAAKELARLVSQEKLGKVSSPPHPPYYITIDKTYKTIDWVNAPDEDTLNIKFPYGVEDQTKFGFDGPTTISPKDIIVIAGQSNAGKTLFCLNFLWENMDFFPCTLMGNEYAPGKFKRRVSRMTWRNPINGDGQAKFELIERFDRWQDIIRPDNITIIDWINLTDNFYYIGRIIEDIRAKLNRGIAVISLQKAGDIPLGRGGTFTKDLASLYLSMDFNRLTVVKAKEWRKYNPNNKIYGFDIVGAGTQFHNIRAIKKCYKCKGSGFSQGGQCEECEGGGYIDDLKDRSCEEVENEDR